MLIFQKKFHSPTAIRMPISFNNDSLTIESLRLERMCDSHRARAERVSLVTNHNIFHKMHQGIPINIFNVLTVFSIL